MYESLQVQFLQQIYAHDKDSPSSGTAHAWTSLINLTQGWSIRFRRPLNIKANEGGLRQYLLVN